MSLPTVTELKKAGVDPNFIIVITEELDNDEMIIHHIVTYENEPTQECIDNLIQELDTDEEFGLVGQIDELCLTLLTKKEYQQLRKQAK